MAGLDPIRANITVGVGENPGPRPLIVITGLDPVRPGTLPDF
jgi:hypothetical protein